MANKILSGPGAFLVGFEKTAFSILELLTFGHSQSEY
jgi:hypothetical protein